MKKMWRSDGDSRNHSVSSILPKKDITPSHLSSTMHIEHNYYRM
jgi:hypothetical protein